ncbi:MAG: glycosyltransferase, partial [Acidobacteriota bacterium]
TSIDAPLDAGDFRLLDRRVVDELTAMGETHLFLRGLTRWLGFRQVSVSYRREARYGGAPKYSTWRSLRLALDGLTSFTAAPMGWMMGIGSAVATVGFLYAAYYVLLKLLVQPESLVPGWTTLLAAILFLGGLQLFCLGLIGLYIGRIFEEVKKRPRYLVQETVDGSGDG